MESCLENIFGKCEDKELVMSHMKDLKYITDDYLKNFIPKVYQENIYAIDYGGCYAKEKR